MGEDGATVGLKGDSWFGSINTCDQLGARGKMGVFQMKKAHSLYQKKRNYAIRHTRRSSYYFGRYTPQWATTHSIGP
jgi:hypothetical protein